MEGSIEIFTATGESIGYPGMSLSKEVVPTVVEALAGITAMDSMTPEKQPSGRVPIAQWTGRDRQSQPVKVFLWPQAPEPPLFRNPEDTEQGGA